MSNPKIAVSLNEAKMALLKLRLELTASRASYAFETEETRLAKQVELAASRLSEHLDKIESLNIASQLSDQEVEQEAEEIADEIASVPINEREPSFKCLSSYKACKADSSGTEDRVLCAIALTICWAKQVIPMAG